MYNYIERIMESYYNNVTSPGMQRTLSFLSSEKVSTMIPNTMFSPMVVMMMKKETSNKIRRPAVSNCWGTSGITCI